MTSIGLHITKCAGTSLISSMRRHLTEDEYIILSSFYENTLASRSDIWDVADFNRILFVFGHYIHERILPLFRPQSVWDIFLFTGVREPTARAISQYYQLKKITGSDLDVQCFALEYGSSMCDEIIRAFPSLINPEDSKWLSAAKILTAFDYIYSTESYSSTIAPVYESVGLSPPSAQSLNSRDNVRIADLDSEIVSQLNSAASISDDTRLYSLIKPAIGRTNAGKIIADELNIPRKREELLAPACQAIKDSATDFNYELFYDMMGYELHLLGKDKKAEFLRIMENKRDRANEIIKFLNLRRY